MVCPRVLTAGIILSIIPALALGEGCPVLRVDERVRLAAVHDGDTLRLSDGRRVRLLAVNAPELASDGKAEQAMARASREAVKAFFTGTNTLHLSFESRRTDRYGRILAHVAHPSGRDLESYLVRQGLALPLAVPPDLAFAECLGELAGQARREGKGLWSSRYWRDLPATQLDGIEAGFRVICGRISQVDRQKDLWVELEGGLAVRIARDDFRYFKDSDFALNEAESWRGRSLRLSGWLQDRSDDERLMQRGFKPWLVQVRTPFALEWMESSQNCE